jgi:hypothetical protein
MQHDSNEPYLEFERALTDVLTEREYFLARRSRLARARAAADKNDPRYWEAVESAFSAIESIDHLGPNRELFPVRRLRMGMRRAP